MAVAILRENDVDRHEIAIGFDTMEGKVNFDRNALLTFTTVQSGKWKAAPWIFRRLFSLMIKDSIVDYFM